MGARLDRRLFLLGGLGGLAALQRPLCARPSPGPERTLVLIQLTGGHDGLSMLVPYSDDAYGRARRTTRIQPEEVLRLDERVGLHPGLKELRELFDHGRVAWIEGIGYPEPVRSHFRSMDVWHAADARGRGTGTGWIGRCVEALPEIRPHTVVHLGTKPPFSLYSTRQSPLCLTPALMRITEPGRAGVREASAALEPAPDRDEAGGLLELVRGRMRDAEASAARLHAVLDARREHAPYPGSGLAQDLRSAAALIHAEVGMRVCSIEVGGFDTHRDQRGRHDRLMGDLDRALGAFWKDLVQSEAGRESLVVLYSEFGRRFEENDSRGTDHGSAGLALALGARVRGGLHGAPPALDALVDGDPAFTTDFRRLYADAVGHVFGFEPEVVLGDGPAPLGIV